MRILGGEARGRRLAGPNTPQVRPTAAKVKASLFNIIRDRIAGAQVLDLYAGTGLIGIEALSRGAQHVTFVETNPALCHLLRHNLTQCGYDKRADIHTIDVARFLTSAPPVPFDIIFVDPPYHTEETERILPLIGRAGMITPHGIMIVEHFHKTRLPQHIGGLIFIKSYQYGDSVLSLYQPATDDAAR